MSITPFLDDNDFTPDLTRVAKVALEMTRVALHYPADNHPDVALAAKRIVELVKDGEHDPDRLCEQVLADVRGHS
jgi:hypothetical protein